MEVWYTCDTPAFLDRDSTVVQHMSETEENIDVANVDNNAIPNLLPGMFNRNLVP